MSFKSKVILCILLSNLEGWTSYQKTILSYIKEGTTALSAALKELEEFGYLLRLRYQERKTKKFVGSFWAYTNTPFKFNTDDHLKRLIAADLELTSTSSAKYREMYISQATTGFSTTGSATSGKPKPNYINNKRFKYSKRFKKFWKLYDKKVGHKRKAFDYFEALSEKQQKEVLKIVPKWIATIGKDKNYRPYPTSFLFQKRYNDEIPKVSNLKQYKNGHVNKAAKSKAIEVPAIDIIRKRTGGYYRIVIKTHDQLFDKSDPNFRNRVDFSKSEGAVAICDLEDDIKDFRKYKYSIVKKYNNQIKSASIITSDYVSWLRQKDQKWIDNISVKLFDTDHTLFKRFVKQQSSNEGRNILTGQYN